ncbi:MAG TPA: hypothetical protein VFG10_13400 [Saprospiraceae bacterium]|nr:hypothetical protein [Saprospiraceae bacterium]
MATSDDESTFLPRVHSFSIADYPECPNPEGVVRYESHEYETVYFRNSIDQKKFHYEIKLTYGSQSADTVVIKVTSGSSYIIDYIQYNIPERVEIRRICHQLVSPFIYESDWVLVPLVQTSRTSEDSICEQFNGADLIIDPDNHIYKYNCLFGIRGSFINVRVLLEVDYCTTNDSSLYIYAYPFAYSAGSNKVCAMTMTLQYQSPNGQWHQCDEIVVYENIDNYVSASCDGDHSEVEIENTTLLTTLAGVDIIYVGGFPVRIIDLDSPLSGTGIIRLPFQDKDLVIEFHDLDVNEDHQVVNIDNGSYITAVSSGDLSIPFDNLSTEEERCVEPQKDPEWNSDGTNVETDTIWDPNGFCQNGQYCKEPPYQGYEEGDPFDPDYDPCGFNAQGIHRETGTKFNLSGCSRDSLTNANPAQHCELNCIPYYWLQDPEATEPGIAFYDSIRSQLPSKVDSLLEVLEDDLESELNLKTNECAGIVEDMRDIVTTNGIDSISIFGENSEYIRPGLAERFIRKPEPFKVNMVRDQAIVNLENFHIQLYECDLLESELESKLEILHEIKGDTSDLMEYLAVRIKAFTETEANAINTHNEWMLRLISLIEQFIDQEYKEINGIGINLNHNFINKESTLEPRRWQYNESNESQLNYISNAFIGSIELLDDPGEDMAFGGSPTGNVLPLDLNVELLGEIHTITITRIGFHPEYLTLDAFIRIENPLNAEQIVFSCHDVHFSPHGLFEAGRLELADTISTKLLNVANLILNPEHTFVEWDCSGFKELSIDGYIEFCNNTLLPLDSITGEPLIGTTEKVKAFFKTDITSFSGFFAELTVEPFAVASAPNIRFTVDSAYLDFSTSESPPIAMPFGYNNENCIVTGSNQTFPTPFWQGFMLGHLRATVASGISDLQIDVHNAVIDDRGFSAFVRISQPITSIDTGNIGKWPVSVDALRLHFLFNNLIGAGFEGLINVPIFRGPGCGTANAVDSTDCFHYTADYLGGGAIQISVQPKAEMCVPLWKGKVVLDSNSVVTITEIDGDFTIEAKLFGYADFDSLGIVTIDSARFENVRLRNRAPYFSTGNWYVKELGFDIGGFGLSLKNITLDTIPGEEEKIQINFVAGIEINEDFNVSAYGGFSVFGNLVESNNRQKWVFHNLAVNSLFLNADIKGTHISGFLKYFDTHYTYGNGFKAAVQVSFPKISKEPGDNPVNEEGEGENALFSVAASGIFGKKNDFNYFNVDALAQFDPGIPLGALQIMGLGGGLSYHMQIQDSLLALPTNMNVATDSASIFNMSLGSSLTGANYVPDITKGIGIKLIMAGAINDEKICSYNAVFQIAFSSSGSIAYVGLKGTVRIMAALELPAIPEFPESSILNKVITASDLEQWNAPDINASIRGYFAIAYTAPDSVNGGDLQGNFALYMNAGDDENPFITGKALAEVYISKDEWYFNVGRLRNDLKGRAELTIDLAIANATVQTYLNIGTGIPPMPDPPKPIMDLFGPISSPDASLGWGTGFAFGVGVGVELNEDFFFGSIEIQAGFGFDLAIKRYEKAQCANTGSQIGINGWYATGQAYMYLNGSVKILGANLLDISTGVLVQAGFPNPTWVKGKMILKYKLLFIKGKIPVNIEVGQQCIIEGGEESDLPDIISSVIPMSGSSGVDVLSSINVDFNLPMNQEIKFTSGEDNVTYTTRIDSVELRFGSGDEIDLVEELEEGNQYARYTPEFTLPPNDSFTFIIKVKVFKEGIELTDLDGLERIVGFRTWDAIATIPLRNIEATYPIHGMNNFYRNEYKDNYGYIILQRNQYELMNQSSNESLAIIVSSPNEHFIGKADYISQTKTISFKLPPQYLEQGEFYQIELTKTKNINKLVPGDLVSLDDSEYAAMKKMWKAVFRVSNYESCFDKIEGLGNNMDVEQTLSFEEFYVSCLSLPISIDEPFDETEILPVSGNVQSMLSSSNTMIQFALDVNELKSNSDYASDWTWIDNLLKDFLDPISNYLANQYGQDEDRYSGLNSSIYVGSECGFINENLQSSLDFSSFENLSGYAAMENLLELNQLADVETIEGNQVDPYDASIAASQNIVISLPRILGGIVSGGPSYASTLINMAITDCMKELNGGRSRGTNQPCSASSLVPSDLIDLSGNQYGYPILGDEVHLPIVMRYILPGSDYKTSEHRFILTYTIN